MDTKTTKKKVAEFVRRYQMAGSGDGVLAAVSGGADSVCLLLLLDEMREELGIRLGAFHLNHGLRGAEADRDETYVRKLCEGRGIPLTVKRVDVAAYGAEKKISEEEAGRILRYGFLEEEAAREGFSKIATAHHRNDNQETVLMNLFRGSGLGGLGGIPPVRGKIIRPLLCLGRREIEEYLGDAGLGWCEDSTNRENLYQRNKIRNELLPWIRENINGQAGEHLLKTAALAAAADEYFEGLAGRILGTRPWIETAVFDAQPEIVKTYLIRGMMTHAFGGTKNISESHIRSVMALLGPGNHGRTDLPGGFFAVRGYERLEIKAVDGEEKSRGEQGEGVSYATRMFPWKKGMEIPKTLYTKWFDYDKIKNRLIFRRRQKGDYFQIAGGKTKTVRRYFIDEKIPESQRDSVPLFADGNHILWIVGHRISEYYKVTDETKNVIEITVDKGELHG